MKVSKLLEAILDEVKHKIRMLDAIEERLFLIQEEIKKLQLEI